MTALPKETPGPWVEVGNRRGTLLARLATGPRSLAAGHCCRPRSRPGLRRF